jgi:ABC-2 type transport system ATP-binding protein
MDAPAVQVEDVHVNYGSLPALDGVSLSVDRGTTLAVLGHNGAGKTTLIRVLATQIRPRRGRVLVDGIDALARPADVRRRIGVTGQFSGLDEYLTAVENLELIGWLIGLRRGSRSRAHELIERFDLGNLANRRVMELSGGSRRRIDLAASLVGSPSVVMLDEPTTGLDPTARVALWSAVDELNDRGTTVLLTTQNLDEADRLAGSILVLGHGRIAARGTPTELKALVGGKVVRATVAAHQLATLGITPDDTHAVDAGYVRVSLRAPNAAAAAALVAQLIHDSDAGDLADLDIESPSLDDVFFHLAKQGATA